MLLKEFKKIVDEIDKKYDSIDLKINLDNADEAELKEIVFDCYDKNIYLNLKTNIKHHHIYKV